MSALHRPRSVRFRLTLSYVGAMVVVLAVYATLIFYFVSHNMSQFLDNQLRERFRLGAGHDASDPQWRSHSFRLRGNRRKRQSLAAVLSPTGELVSASPEALAPPDTGQR